MENSKNLKWHQRPLGVIFMLIVFWPVGVGLMWKNKIWSEKTRTIITGLFLVALVVSLIVRNLPSSSSKQHQNMEASTPVGKYYRKGSQGVESIVTLNIDGTWIKETYVDGKKHEWLSDASYKGTWELKEVSKDGLRDKKTYNVVIFNNDSHNAYVYENGCFSTTNDDVARNSEYLTSSDGVFGVPYEDICKDKN
jgi:hypothetical protein